MAKGKRAGRETLHEGPLQKHKRKQYQGFAKRWFILDSNGVLSYSVQPKAHIRDSVNLQTATIARSKNSRSIHIDSDTATWHLKALTDDDFTTWTEMLSRFTEMPEKADTSFGVPGVAGVGREQKKAPEPEVNLAEVAEILAKMTSPLRDIEMVVNQAENHDSGPSKPLQKITKVFKKSNHDNNETHIDSESEQLRNAHGQLFRHHRRLLELVSPSKATGTLGASEGVASLNHDIIASRSAMGIMQPGVKDPSKDDDGDSNYEDARDFDLDAIAMNAQAYESGPADSSDASGDDSDADSESSQTSAEGGDEEEKDDGTAEDKVQRRKTLPSENKADEGGVFGVLKNSIGKDLSKISFPVSFNEPINALQKQAEELEFASLIRKAVQSKDNVDKLCYLGAYAVALLAGTKQRSTKKPFNPLLGETYELDRPDKGFRIITEKVKHHPPITAFYAEGKGWTYDGHSTGSQKFWGRSLEYFPSGKSTFHLGEEKPEDFTWDTRPNATVRGIMGGSKSIEYNGKIVIKHENSKAKCEIKFKKNNQIEGSVCGDDGSEAAQLTGTWDQSVSRKTGEDSYKELWKAYELPKGADKYFFFSEFASQLNEITDDIKEKLPQTDTRYRPDQRAYEEGDPGKADQIKEKLENNQRSRREKWEKGDAKPVPPAWFDEKSSDKYEYKGEYWEKREKGEWPDLPEIFDDK